MPDVSQIPEATYKEVEEDDIQPRSFFTDGETLWISCAERESPPRHSYYYLLNLTTGLLQEGAMYNQARDIATWLQRHEARRILPGNEVVVANAESP